jgi:hypothetical protein
MQKETGKMAKVIQIATAVFNQTAGDVVELFALDDAGNIFSMSTGERVTTWVKVPPVPTGGD